ncbi:hypothetical protein CCR94_01960 [Rhodoblastus sphagnicola]|uniref:Uncharacterized protein n=1 Tax=Rhodoblastus sphagnicola TaxID=333368 RepID=A0A2S6NFL0_9HYPH|nr:hypothetical protein [Rhodoblastus sphagnicola]MBB4199204.1 hypothetical protein [Rhodoblastus sphagnicola]PPQ33387.1 hypothetical protein CCR94_01960 [Rhodoblastus sphagnicola]
MRDTPEARAARQATYEALDFLHRYAESAMIHLEVADDAGVVWDMMKVREFGRKAFAAFGPINAAIVEQGRPARLEAAE